MAAPVRSGIPTTYSASNFRSRLEARWAAFFDQIGWRWTYEPLDASGYIPDFLIMGPTPLFIEVGPCITQSDYEEKSSKPDSKVEELKHDVLIVGVSPVVNENYSPDHPTAGWLGERRDFYPEDIAPGHTATFNWGPALWNRCKVCQHVNIHHEWMGWNSRPCGHYDGDHYLMSIDARHIETLWRRASNLVQWKVS